MLDFTIKPKAITLLKKREETRIRIKMAEV